MAPPAATIRFCIGERSADGTYPLVAFTPGGTTRGTLALPEAADDYQEILARLASFEADAAAISRLGRMLFDALFPPEIRASYRATRALLAHGQHLRLVLDIPADAAAIAAAPWEFLWDPEADAPLALRATSVVRYLPQTVRVPALEVSPPLRVLLTAAQTDPPVDVQRELAAVQAALSELGDRVQVAVEPNLTTERLMDLLRADYHVWHFVGHGHTADDGTSQLILEDEHGDAAPLDAAQLSALLAGSGVRLAVLDACGSGQVRTTPMRSTATALVAAGVPAVIAMQLPVPEETTRTFATALYQALADGEPIDGCVTEGRKAVLTTLGHRPDWGIPVVLTRTLDGRLFAPVRAAPSAPATATSPTTQSDRNLRVLRQKVRSFWVDGVLHNSLAQAVLIDLGLTERSEAVLPQWDAVVQRSGEADQHLPPGTLLVDVFDEQEQALLILGAPGAGKTTMVLELARVLLDRAERDPSFPAPVVFNLSSWAMRRVPLEDWLVEELFTRYDVPRKLGRQWVEAGQVLPLLDGLDEVAAEHRNACAATINTFREAHGLVPIAVCCRTADYEALTTKLTLRGAVVVQLLAPEQIDSALALGGEPLARLRTAVREDEGLRELAQTPLMLSVMMLAYHGTTAAIAPGAGRAEQRATIFDAYIEAMFSRRGVPSYGRDTMLAWLAWMAREMQRQAQSIFQIEGLQPEWLPDPRARSTYWLIDRLGWGSIAALVVGIAAAIVAGIAAGPVAAVVIGISAGLSLGLGIALVGGDRQAQATQQALQTLGSNAFVGAALSGVAGGLIGAMVGGTATGLVAWFLSGPVIGVGAGIEYALRIGLSVGLGAGILGGLGSALTGRPGVRPRSVVVVSQVRWSGRKALRTMLVVGLGVGLVVAVVGAGLFTLSSGPALGLGAGIGFGLVFGLVTGLGAGLIGGMQTGDVTTTSRPNEGIRRSARMAAVIGGLAFGIVFALAVLLRFGLLGGAVFGLAFALPVALAYGGYAVLSHLALRLILWQRRLAPWHYAAFLDSAADRVFLRKVGGGYIFIHRLLLEHLASGEEPRGASIPEEVAARTAGATG